MGISGERLSRLLELMQYEDVVYHCNEEKPPEEPGILPVVPLNARDGYCLGTQSIIWLIPQAVLHRIVIREMLAKSVRCVDMGYDFKKASKKRTGFKPRSKSVISAHGLQARTCAGQNLRPSDSRSSRSSAPTFRATEG
ncbi:hypothetical protein AcV7_007545 [Taiwanofungus camphoratus]|nr:hypothetical protein AcV7_007545 [Antrodia cinnamomea]